MEQLKEKKNISKKSIKKSIDIDRLVNTINKYWLTSNEEPIDLNKIRSNR